MIKFGIISELDENKGLARVQFEEDDIVSDWLKISVKNTLANKDEVWFDINEPVWCIMDENSENGIIGGSYYHDNNTPTVKDKDKRAVTFEDGTKIIYDRSASKLIVECVGDVEIECVNATVKATDKVIIDTPESEFKGNVTVEGNIDLTGNLKADLEVSANNVTPATVVRLSTHIHATPAGPSSPPTPGT